MPYSVGDLIKLTTDDDARAGEVLAVNGVMIMVGWANGGRTEFSARVLERLTSEPDCQDRGRHPLEDRIWPVPFLARSDGPQSYRMAEANGHDRPTRSGLKAWFLRHHTELSAAHENTAVIDTISKQRHWNEVAARARAEGLTTRGGKPITAAYARQVWWRAQATYRRSRDLELTDGGWLAPTPVPPTCPVMLDELLSDEP